MPGFLHLIVRATVAAFLVLATASAAAAVPRDDREERRRDATEAMTVTVRADPGLFSPNGDGRRDETTIRVQVDLASSVDVAVLGPDGGVKRSWTRPASPEAPATVTWDGKGEGGQVLPDGTYTVRAKGTEPNIVGEGTTQVTLDTRAPAFRWSGTSPSVVSTQSQVQFRFRATDGAAPIHVVAVIEDEVGQVATVERNLQSGDATLTWKARRMYPGTYFVSFRAVDAAGNEASAGRFPWRVQRPTRAKVWNTVPGSGARVAITFDDCHNSSAWTRILAVLREREAGATFFCPGRQMQIYSQLVRRTIADGHVIGSHGWDHADMTKQSSSSLARRLRQDAGALWKIAKRTTSPYMRPPYGAFNGGVVATSGQTAHPRVIMWDVDPRDWTSPGVSSIVKSVLRESRRGSIVVMHTLPQTAAALPAIVSGLRERGLEPAGLPEMFAAAR